MPVLANSASRLLSLGLLTLLLNKQGWPGLLVFLIPLAYLFIQHPKPGKQVVLLARRLRWFYLSILILYFWFYPGTDLFPLMGRFSPSIEGVNEAGLRITSLLVVISYSVFLLKLTPRGEIISAIQFILSPLSYLGIDSNRFALRLGLVLSIVPDMNVEQSPPVDKKRRTNLSAVIDKAAAMVKQADELTNLPDMKEITITRMKRAGVLDILIPLSLLIWLLSY